MNDKLKFYRSTLVEMTKEAYRKKPKELKTDEAVDEADILTESIMKKVDEFEIAMEQHVILDEERRNYYTNNTMWTGPAFIGKSTKFDLSSNSVKQMVDSVKKPMRTIVDNGPQYPSDNEEELDYVCKLTQYDIDDIETRLNQVIKYYKDFKENHITEEQFNEFTKRNIGGVIGYLKNEGGIRKKDQIMQLSRQKATKYQKPYDALGEHFEELSYLFDFKKNHSFYKNALQNFIKKYKKKDFNQFEKDDSSFSFITEHETKCLIDIANSLGIEFIEDFVKACEKCEEEL